MTALVTGVGDGGDRGVVDPCLVHDDDQLWGDVACEG